MDDNDALIQKETVYAGTKYVQISNGTKVNLCLSNLIDILCFVYFQVKFHYETRRKDNQVVIDDSRIMKEPMVLVLGKKFKLEVWEVIVKKMSLNEVARFTVDKQVNTYFV